MNAVVDEKQEIFLLRPNCFKISDGSVHINSCMTWFIKAREGPKQISQPHIWLKIPLLIPIPSAI